MKSTFSAQNKCFLFVWTYVWFWWMQQAWERSPSVFSTFLCKFFVLNLRNFVFHHQILLTTIVYILDLINSLKRVNIPWICSGCCDIYIQISSFLEEINFPGRYYLVTTLFKCFSSLNSQKKFSFASDFVARSKHLQSAYTEHFLKRTRIYGHFVVLQSLYDKWFALQELSIFIYFSESR